MAYKRGHQGIICKRSRSNMTKTMNKLQCRLKYIPEGDLMRDTIIRKIEMLKIIRKEMKELLKNLE